MLLTSIRSRRRLVAERDRAVDARAQATALYEKAKAERDRSRALRNETKAQRDRARERLRVFEQRSGLTGFDLADSAPTFGGLGAERGGRGKRPFFYFPGSSLNPYFRLLYAALPLHGFDPQPLPAIDNLSRLTAGTVVHLHWLGALQAGCKTEVEARERSAAFLEPISDFVARGGDLIWTIHEVLSHDCVFPEVETELRARLAELARVIHVLHASTVEEATTSFAIDGAKVFVVEMPSYTGVYPDYVTRASARATLGIGDEPLILCFGAIRHYKGFDRVVRLLGAIRERTGTEARVVIAGYQLQSVDIADLQQLVADEPGATLLAGGITDDEIQVLYRAADLAVLPYRKHVNSSVLMVSMAFGLPVVVARNAVTEALAPLGRVRLFEAESDADLLDAIVEGLTDPPRPGAVSDELFRLHEPASVAGRFAAGLARRLASIGSDS